MGLASVWVHNVVVPRCLASPFRTARSIIDPLPTSTYLVKTEEVWHSGRTTRLVFNWIVYSWDKLCEIIRWWYFENAPQFTIFRKCRNRVNQRMLYFPEYIGFLLFGFRIALILFRRQIRTKFVKKKIGISTNFSCMLLGFFSNVAQRKSEISANFSCRLFFQTD